MHPDNEAALGRFVDEATVGFAGLDRRDRGRGKGVERLPHRVEQHGRIAVIAIAEKGSIRRRQVVSLRGWSAIPYLSRTLVGDLLVEAPLRVFLTALVGLVDRDGNELRLEKSDNFRMAETRLTVEDSVVSRASEGMPVHRPDKQGLLFGRGPGLRLEKGGLPWNRAPGFFTGWLKIPMQGLELGLRNRSRHHQYSEDRRQVHHVARIRENGPGSKFVVAGAQPR